MKSTTIMLLACIVTGCQSTPPSDTRTISSNERTTDHAVATVLGNELDYEQLEFVIADYLVGRILPPLLDEFRHEQHITVSEDEVNDFKSSPIFDEQVSPEVSDKIAEDFVLRWKTSKVLYEKYGGAVVFQQANPLTPIEAYHAFLIEHEQKSSFHIQEPYRTAFWKYFTRDYGPWVVSPEDIDFTIPWWNQRHEE